MFGCYSQILFISKLLLEVFEKLFRFQARPFGLEKAKYNIGQASESMTTKAAAKPQAQESG